jgi:hypothetical protein
MNEYGITRYCVCCNKSFNCTDGDYFCSSKCSDKWDEMNFEDQEIDKPL